MLAGLRSLCKIGLISPKREIDGIKDRQIDGSIDRQMGRQIDRQMGRQIDGQKDGLVDEMRNAKMESDGSYIDRYDI